MNEFEFQRNLLNKHIRVVCDSVFEDYIYAVADDCTTRSHGTNANITRW